MKNKVLGLVVAIAAVGLISYKYDLLSMGGGASGAGAGQLTPDQERILQLGPVKESMEAQNCLSSDTDRDFLNFLYRKAGDVQTWQEGVDYNKDQMRTGGNLRVFRADRSMNAFRPDDEFDSVVIIFSRPIAMAAIYPFVGKQGMEVHSLGFSPDESRIIISERAIEGAPTGQAQVWDLRRLEEVARFVEKNMPVLDCELLKAFALAVRNKERIHATPAQMRLFRQWPQVVQEVLQLYIRESR